ncbi:hypothetical protein EIP91_011453 [Steccherinum ochraceum]|uniref:Uncharacterized protein n=1 Tax=Steccherinum ochraceum TaxID=92696 RepID=A0A4R0RPU4_9APHY|nr:hypothetical protein EIP91_011453 [Steccherinum ochraceum]
MPIGFAPYNPANRRYTPGKANTAPRKEKRPASEEDARYTLPGGPPLTRSFSSYAFIDTEARAPQTGPDRVPKSRSSRRSGLSRDGSIHMPSAGSREANDGSDSENEAPSPKASHSTIPEDDIPSFLRTDKSEAKAKRRSAKQQRKPGTYGCRHLYEEDEEEVPTPQPQPQPQSQPQSQPPPQPQSQPQPPPQSRPRPAYFNDFLANMSKQREEQAAFAQANARRVQEEFVRQQRFRESMEYARREQEHRAQQEERERQRVAEERLRQAREEAARREAQERRAREERARRAREAQEKWAREQEQRRAPPPQASQDDTLARARQWYATYEQKWAALQSPTLVEGPVYFNQVPWPVTFTLTCPAEITKEAISTFLFHECRPDIAGKSKKKVIRSEILRFHPDKFNTTTIPRADPAHVPVIAQAADIVIKHLNTLSAELANN